MKFFRQPKPKHNQLWKKIVQIFNPGAEVSDGNPISINEIIQNMKNKYDNDSNNRGTK